VSLYAYCLGDDIKLEMIGSSGVAEAPVYLIDTRGLAAVVSDFDGAMVPVNRGAVLSHERVVASILAATTPLPFRFGTLVSQEKLESYVESNFEKLLLQLNRVRGSVEMSVKIIWRPEKKDDEGAERSRVVSAETGPGSRFLMAKRRELEESESLKEHGEEIASWLASIVECCVRESVVQVRPGGSLALSAAHLVERHRLEEYRHRVSAGLAERIALRFLTSGPWPPYSFCDLSG